MEDVHAEHEEGFGVNDTGESSEHKKGPGLFVVATLFLVACGVGMLMLTGALFNTPRGAEENGLHVQVGDRTFTASLVRLDTLNPEDQSLVFGHEALFIVFAKGDDALGLKLSEQPIDVMWLDASFHIVSFERGKTPGEDEALRPPSGAFYAFVTRKGLLSEHVFVEGDRVLVLEREKLL